MDINTLFLPFWLPASGRWLYLSNKIIEGDYQGWTKEGLVKNSQAGFPQAIRQCIAFEKKMLTESSFSSFGVSWENYP